MIYFLQIGFLEQHYSWNSVFVLMSIMIFCSSIPLIKSVRKEIAEIRTLRRLQKEIDLHQEEAI